MLHSTYFQEPRALKYMMLIYLKEDVLTEAERTHCYEESAACLEPRGLPILGGFVRFPGEAATTRMKMWESGAARKPLPRSRALNRQAQNKFKE